MSEPCAYCKDEKWTCENHKDKPWPNEYECGAGQPCVLCNDERYPEMPPGFGPPERKH